QDGQVAPSAPDQPAGADPGQTPEQEAADKAAHEAAVRDAEKLADKGIAAYVAGQRAELRQTMEACACWHEYLLRRMALGPGHGPAAWPGCRRKAPGRSGPTPSAGWSWSWPSSASGRSG